MLTRWSEFHLVQKKRDGERQEEKGGEEEGKEGGTKQEREKK